MARYCIYCGKPVKEKNKFCTHCGKSMLSKTPQTVNKTPDVIPEIAHEKMIEKVEEITDEDGSEESIYSKSMKLTDIRIRDLFKGEKLTFLVGAGCSMDPPSCLPAGKPMMEAIINYVCADSEIEKILKLEDLRFEQLVEILRDRLDEELKIIDYYGQCDKPNLQHFFLAEMIKNGHFVMTTNFDFLIEYALQQSGVPNELILPVITKNDYQNYSNPDDLLSKGKKTLYKIHGSTKNIVSLENTRDSLVATIQAFGSNKEGENVFQIEPFKRPLFENISSGRSLVVMGYSGSDDFDIVPTLMVLKNLKNIVWINYIPDDGGIEKIYEINNSTLEETENSDKVNQILSNIYRMHNADHVYRANVNTTRLIEELIDIKPNLSSNYFSISPMTWLKNTINPPDEFIEYYIPYKIYDDFDRIDDAMNCAKIILELAEQKSDKNWKSTALNNIGLLLYGKGELDEALKHYREALEISEQLGDLQGKAAKLNNIGALLYDKGELDGALKHYREVLEITEQLGDLRGKATNLNNIGLLLKGKGELDEALKHYREALKINEQLGDLRGKAARLSNIGSLLGDKGELDEALKHYREALEIGEQLGDLRAKATNLNNIGSLLKGKGELEVALKHYREALEINEQLGDLRGKATMLNNIGSLLKGKGELEVALKHYREALEINEQLGDLRAKATNLTNIGTINFAQENYPEALKLYEEALQIDEQIGNLTGKATRLNNIGVVHYTKGNYPEALKRYEGALQIVEQLGDVSGKGLCLNNIGEIFRAQGNYPEALKRYEEALQIAEQLGDLSGKATRLNNIGMIYVTQENYPEALKHYREALKINEQLGDLSRKTIFLNNIGMIYETQENYPEALKQYEEALEILTRIGLGDSPNANIFKDSIKYIKSKLSFQTESQPLPQQDLEYTEIEKELFAEIERQIPSYLKKCETGIEYLKKNGLYLYLQLPSPKELLENIESRFQQGEIEQAQYNELKNTFTKMMANGRAEDRKKPIKIPPGFEPDHKLPRPYTFKTQDNQSGQLSEDFMDHFELTTEYDLSRLVRNCSIILTNFNGTLDQDNLKLHLERLKKLFRDYSTDKKVLGFVELTIALMIINTLLPSKANFPTKEFYYLAGLLCAIYKLFSF